MKNNIIFTIFLFLFSLSFYAQDTGFGDLSDSETDSADSGFGDLSSIEAPADDGSSSFGESGSQATEDHYFGCSILMQEKFLKKVEYLMKEIVL